MKDNKTKFYQELELKAEEDLKAVLNKWKEKWHKQKIYTNAVIAYSFSFPGAKREFCNSIADCSPDKMLLFIEDLKEGAKTHEEFTEIISGTE